MKHMITTYDPLGTRYQSRRDRLMALLIFYGTTNVYLKALGKTLPEQWQELGP